MKKILFILDWSSPWNDQLRYFVTDSRFHEITAIFVLTLGSEPSKQGPRLIFGKLRRVYHVITYWQHSWEISNK